MSFTRISIKELVGEINKCIDATIQNKFEVIEKIFNAKEQSANLQLLSRQDHINNFIMHDWIPFLIKTHAQAITEELCVKNKWVVHENKILNLIDTELMIKDILIISGYLAARHMLQYHSFSNSSGDRKQKNFPDAKDGFGCVIFSEWPEEEKAKPEETSDKLLSTLFPPTGAKEKTAPVVSHGSQINPLQDPNDHRRYRRS